MASPGTLGGEEDPGFLEVAATPHTRQIFLPLVPDISDSEDDDDLSTAQRRGSLIGRVQSYSRIMHSYTMLQMQSSPNWFTLPGYQKAMYEFTQSQMKRQRNASKARSETSSPHMMAQQAVTPSPVGAGLPQMSLDEPPPPPCPSPSPENHRTSLPKSSRLKGLRQRSTTKPIPRDFAIGVGKERAGIAWG